MGIAAKVFERLQGYWSLERIIRGSENALARGVSSFIPVKGGANTLYYCETGLLATLRFSREYFYRLTPPDLQVFFCRGGKEEGFSHTLSFEKEGGKAKGAHSCSSDRYEFSYNFSALSQKDTATFEIFCKVLGPAKNYTISTTLRQISEEQFKKELSIIF